MAIKKLVDKKDLGIKKCLKISFTVSIILSATMFILLAAGVFGLPTVDAHVTGFVEPDGSGVAMVQIDLGLFDKWFFQWHRPHITIDAFAIISLDPLRLKLFDVSQLEDGIYLNTYPLVLVILTSIILAFDISLFVLNCIYNRNSGYGILNMSFILALLGLMIVGLALKSGNALSSVINITADTRKIDTDVDYIFDNMRDPDKIYGYNMTSIINSYTATGCAGAGITAAVGGMFTVMIVNYYKHYAKLINWKKIAFWTKEITEEVYLEEI